MGNFYRHLVIFYWSHCKQSSIAEFSEYDLEKTFNLKLRRIELIAWVTGLVTFFLCQQDLVVYPYNHFWIVSSTKKALDITLGLAFNNSTVSKLESFIVEMQSCVKMKKSN